MREFRSNCFLNSELFKAKANVEPDIYVLEKNVRRQFDFPDSKFVICRNQQNEVTAMYGDDIWDLTPWKFSEDSARFRLIFDLKGWNNRAVQKHLPSELYRHLVDQLKWLTFSLIYFVDTGYSGGLSNNTLRSKYLTIKSLAVYVAEQNRGVKKNLRFDLFDLLEQEQRFAEYLRVKNVSDSVAKNLSGVFDNLRKIPKEILGFSVLVFSHTRELSDNQTPVIPSRIYMQYLIEMNKLLDVWDSEKEKIESFLKAFSDPLYGVSIENQRQLGGGVRKSGRRPDLKQVLKIFGLERVFVGSFKLKGRHNLVGVIGRIQYSLLMGVCFYTGMRIEEAQSLPYNAIKSENVAVNIDGDNVLTDSVIDVISRTTKFTGFKAYASWIAPDAVKRIVSIAQHICNGLAHLHGLEPDNCHLFLEPSAISEKRKLETSHAFQITARRRKGFWSEMDSFIIDDNDYEELKLTDPQRDWDSDSRYQIGQRWPLRTHQCRRSLGFYGMNSGMISATSLRRQFKQLSLAMARYYANNFENMHNVFGYQESADSQFKVNEHVALDFQTNLTMWQARRIIEEVLQYKEGLLGKRGEFVDRRRRELASGNEVVIIELRKETESRVRSGELSYRSTLLGGCMKQGKCDSFLFGDFTACIDCEDASLQPSKIKHEIREQEIVVQSYDEDSLEHKIEYQNLERLKSVLKKVQSREGSDA